MTDGAYSSHHMRISLNRTQVEAQLQRMGSSLGQYIDKGRSEGMSMEDMWLDLRTLTGVPFSTRTFYRWAESLEKVS